MDIRYWRAPVSRFGKFKNISNFDEFDFNLLVRWNNNDRTMKKSFYSYFLIETTRLDEST